MLNEPGLTDAERRELCNRYNFDLRDALGSEAGLETPRRMLEAVAGHLDELRRRYPEEAEYAHDLSASYQRLGDVLLRLNRSDEALARFQNSLAIRDELRRRYPTEQEYARDLVVSHYKLWQAYRSIGNAAEATRHRSLCRDALLDMRQHGLYLDEPMQRLLAQLQPPAGAPAVPEKRHKGKPS
jgi:tetratricopeptide (TPR) repeat protein